MVNKDYQCEEWAQDHYTEIHTVIVHWPLMGELLQSHSGYLKCLPHADNIGYIGPPPLRADTRSNVDVKSSSHDHYTAIR